MYKRNYRSFPISQKHKGLKYSKIQYIFKEVIKTLFLIVKTRNHLIVGYWLNML